MQGLRAVKLGDDGMPNPQLHVECNFLGCHGDHVIVQCLSHLRN